MKKSLTTAGICAISAVAFAGGNPTFVELPSDYKASFEEYDTRNRANGKQVAVLYANDVAIQSVAEGAMADGSTIIMEIYKIAKDENDKPLTDDNGLFVKSAHAATAVMTKKQSWDTEFDEIDRSGDWGYAIYNADGSVKKNDLQCVACHQPYQSTEYMFSYSSLLDHVLSE
ncbi:MAG: cytochrome P460 family protein [Pseudomonadota bacterium]